MVGLLKLLLICISAGVGACRAVMSGRAGQCMKQTSEHFNTADQCDLLLHQHCNQTDQQKSSRCLLLLVLLLRMSFGSAVPGVWATHNLPAWPTCSCPRQWQEAHQEHSKGKPERFEERRPSIVLMVGWVSLSNHFYCSAVSKRDYNRSKLLHELDVQLCEVTFWTG